MSKGKRKGGGKGWEVKNDRRTLKIVILGICSLKLELQPQLLLWVQFYSTRMQMSLLYASIRKRKTEKRQKSRGLLQAEKPVCWWRCGMRACKVCHMDMLSDKNLQ